MQLDAKPGSFRLRAPEVASVTPTHGGSPCGTRCAWLAARAPGSAAIEASVCFVDSSCRQVDTARGCTAPTSEFCEDLPPRLTVR
jgi:hypothetical protein